MTGRRLADESFNLIVVENGCAAGTDGLRRRELEILDMIYCQVIGSVEPEGSWGSENMRSCARARLVISIVARTRG
ncbi:hypothetical protein [Thiocapsa marina]|uniref:Uncharacterized protein n=1 Tax=Thiocapsa marina 5811 TaxID=768671 RepID=F9U9R0_9GAMM|nr:hypothetical protein [Thiocapsa marina]EGV18858.1 hypothetical protein ThimaDRAFT_1662 [Thiocapsa marina 5811]